MIIKTSRYNYLSKVQLKQKAVKTGAANIVIAAVFSRTEKKYGRRGKRFVFMEAGHVAQNVYLQAISLDLATVSIGGFQSAQVKQALGVLQDDEEPLYILPIGKVL